MRLAPATARYMLVEHRHTEQRYHGQPIVTQAHTHAVVSVTVDSAPLGFAVEAVVDSAGVAGDAAIPSDAVAAAGGGRLHVHVTEDGTVRASAGSPEGNALLDQLALRMHDVVPHLPPGGAAPGSRWHDTTETRGRTAGIPITIDARQRHETAPAWLESDGHTVLAIETETAYTLTGEGVWNGHEVSLAGTGTGHSRRLLTRDGLVAFGIRTDTLKATIELPASGLRIPLIQVRNDTLRRVH